MLEQTSAKSRPDLLISGCSGALFGPVLAGEQTKKSANSTGTRSRRTAASHQSLDSTSDLGCCQQSEAYRRNADGTAIQPPDRRIGASSPRFFVNPTAPRNAFRYPIANKTLKFIIDKRYQYAIMVSSIRHDSSVPANHARPPRGPSNPFSIFARHSATLLRTNHARSSSNSGLCFQDLAHSFIFRIP